MAKKTYTFDVTQEDIDKGVRGDACNCPIARAARRALKHRKRQIRIGDNTLTLVRNNKNRLGWFDEVRETEHKLPYVASRFVCSFDHNMPVRPFTFEMEL